MLHKYRHTGPSRGPAMRTRTFARCPLLPPFYLCFVSCNMLHERAGHTGHLYYFLPDAIVLPLPLLNPHSSSLPRFRSSYPCSVIYTLPINSFRCEVLIVLTILWVKFAHMTRVIIDPTNHFCGLPSMMYILSPTRHSSRS